MVSGVTDGEGRAVLYLQPGTTRSVQAGPDGELRYYRPLVIAPLCTQCHGDPATMDSAVVRVRQAYPVYDRHHRAAVAEIRAALDARFTDENGVEHPIIMGSYGIGVGRLLACVAEEHRDEHGLALPISVAPYAVTLVALARTDDTREKAEALYRFVRDEIASSPFIGVLVYQDSSLEKVLDRREEGRPVAEAEQRRAHRDGDGEEQPAARKVRESVGQSSSGNGNVVC